MARRSSNGANGTTGKVGMGGGIRNTPRQTSTKTGRATTPPTPGFAPKQSFGGRGSK